MTSDQAQQIVKLQAQLIPIAGAIAAQYDVDFDDLLSEANAAIIERAAHDPSFLAQKENYITRWGAWRARDYARRQCQWQGMQPYQVEIEVTPTDPTDIADTAELADALENLITSLGTQARQVLSLWANGYSVKEIADTLSITPASVCCHKTRIRQTAFTKTGQIPAGIM